VLTEREEKCAIAIALNEPFSGWTKTFTDPRLCAAMVDRLTLTASASATAEHGRNDGHWDRSRRPGGRIASGMYSTW
jgi:hypothetical protein